MVRNMRLLSVRVILIACALQGVTPDARNLASDRLLSIVIVFKGNACDFFENDADSTDVVSSPPRIRIFGHRSEREGRPAVDLRSTGLTSQSIGRHPLRRNVHHQHVVCLDDPIDRLCRWSC